MRFHITTQYRENYGTADEPYWKSKGGDEYIIDVPGFNYDHEMAFKKGQMIVDEMLPKIEYSNTFNEEYIIGWGFVPDDFKTSYELYQLEFEEFNGEILYPAKRMSYNELMETV